MNRILPMAIIAACVAISGICIVDIVVTTQKIHDAECLSEVPVIIVENGRESL